MLTAIKTIVKRAMRYTPYRIVRTGSSNRFQAQDELLHSLKSRGFNPQHIIDGGANVGNFAIMTHEIWPSATIHLVEPQESCRPSLDALAGRCGFAVHSVALGAERGSVRMAADPATTSTGAHVVLKPHEANGAGDEGLLEVPVDTLDHLFGNLIGNSSNALLKLDLQGFELYALQGGASILPRLDVLLIEVSFFAQAYEPPIVDIIKFLDHHQFDLHDIASLSSRRRDNRAHQADFVFVNRSSVLTKDTQWG